MALMPAKVSYQIRQTFSRLWIQALGYSVWCKTIVMFSRIFAQIFLTSFAKFFPTGVDIITICRLFFLVSGILWWCDIVTHTSMLNAHICTCYAISLHLYVRASAAQRRTSSWRQSPQFSSRHQSFSSDKRQYLRIQTSAHISHGGAGAAGLWESHYITQMDGTRSWYSGRDAGPRVCHGRRS